MEPINKAERNSAFINFILLFLVTVSIIVAVIFFSIQVPLEDNKQLRKRLSEMQTERDFSDSFSVVMREVMDEFNKFGSKNRQPQQISREIGYKIDKMDKLVKNNFKGDSSIYTLIVQNFMELNEAKTDLAKQQDQGSYSQNQ